MPLLSKRVAVLAASTALFACVSAASAQTTETWNNVYDLRNRLVEVRRGTDILLRLEYDAQRRLIKKIGEEGVRQYVYDDSNLLAEYDGDGNELIRYDWAPGPDGRDRLLRFTRSGIPGHPTFYPFFDGNGSVTGLTDGAGQVVAGYHLDAWGNFRFPGEIDASANRFAYTAYRFMPEVGQYFAVSRVYDPKIGRFLTQDSYLGDIADVATLHRYTYARNNPTGYVDPDGHESYRQWIGLDKPTTSVELEFLKQFGYNAWNAVSFGALNRQDTLVEKSEAGLINEDQYQLRSGINAGGTLVVAGATIYGAGAAGQLVGGSLMMAGAASGASGGFISSSGSAALDVMTGTRHASEITAAEIAVPTILGGFAGGVFGAGYAAGVRPFEGGPLAPRPPNPATPMQVVEGPGSMELVPPNPAAPRITEPIGTDSGYQPLTPHAADPNVPGGATNYRGRYNAALDAAGQERLPADWDVHHSIPQQLRGDPRIEGIDIDAPSQGRGVPGYSQPGPTTNVHTLMDQEWRQFSRRHPSATREEILNFREYLDWRFHQNYWESRPRPKS